MRLPYGADTDSLTGGEGADSITGGAGNDAINLTETTQVADTVVINAVHNTSSDSARATVTGNDNDTGSDTITGMTWGTDVIQIVTTGTVGFVHGTNTTIGTAIGDVNDGSAGSFLTSVGLINIDNTAATYADLGDIAINFASSSAALTEARFEAALQYNITGSAANNTITTGDLADTIDGGAGDDSITGGAAADSITGGTGADTIVWTATSASEFATETGAASGTDNDFAAGTVGDKVVGFTSGTDILKFAAAAVTNASGTETDTLLTILAAGTVTNTARFVHVNTTNAQYGTAGDMGNAITILNNLTTSAVAIGDSFIAFIDNDTSTDIFYVKQVSTADTIAAQDVTLIGQLTSTAAIANGDVVSF